MLNWWRGKPAEASRVEDEKSELLEPPETPAPVFAARALKSAIFGTPARPDDTIYDDLDRTAPRAMKDITASHARGMSPTKPSGILLTPGTATAKRKSVTFDQEVTDNEAEGKTRAKPGSKSGIPDDCPGKFPSPWVPKSERRSRRRTSLTQALEDAREEQPARRVRIKRRSSESERNVKYESESESHEPAVDAPIKSETAIPDVPKEPAKDVRLDSDTTVDLNEPHSKSGKFWKSEYERYHEDAVIEFKKLVNYKNLAKSYAQSKDAQAMNLSAKLKEEQAKVVDMENKIAQLSAKIARSGREGHDESPAMIKELARQTALAVQYKNQVEEFRVALKENGITLSPQKGVSDDDKSFVSMKMEQTILDTRHELRKAREQLKEMSTLREEVQKLRQALSDTKKASAKLESVNTKLTQELLHADHRFETHLEKCQAKARQSDEQKQKKDEAMQSLQKDYDQLKEQSRSSRRDAEQLLKKSREQLVDLRKELALTRGSDSTVQELQQALQKRHVEHAEVVQGLKTKIEDLKRQRIGTGLGSDGKIDSQVDVTLPIRDWYPPKASPVRESQIPVATTISRPLKTFSSMSSLHDDSFQTPRHRASQPALSEIINNANMDTLPPQRYGPVQHTPMAPATPLSGHFPILPKSPELTMPCFESTQLVEPVKGTHARNCNASPRPSMFNIASSPPKAALVRNSLSRQRSNAELSSRRVADMNTSRLPSQETAKTKASLPPERIAAAKARLEAKAAERKAAQAAGKENVKA